MCEWLCDASSQYINVVIHVVKICKTANMGIFINGNSATPDDVSPGYFMRLDNSFLIRLNIIKHCYNVAAVKERSLEHNKALLQRSRSQGKIVHREGRGPAASC